MRQVGHVASKMHAQPGSTNKTTPNGANTPRWQGVKNTVSQGLHKFASIFSRPKGAPRSVPSGPQFRQIQMGEAKQRIQQCTDELRGLWTPDLGAKPPRPGLSFQGADATGLGTFLRQTTPGTDGKAAAMVMTPFLAATGHQLCQKTEALLIQHGQDGKPVNLELDPSKDEAVKDKAELDRRVKIIDQINTALLDELLGPVSSDSHQQQLQALPLHVQAAITAIGARRNRCSVRGPHRGCGQRGTCDRGFGTPRALPHFAVRAGETERA